LIGSSEISVRRIALAIAQFVSVRVNVSVRFTTDGIFLASAAYGVFASEMAGLTLESILADGMVARSCSNCEDRKVYI